MLTTSYPSSMIKEEEDEEPTKQRNNSHHYYVHILVILYHREEEDKSKGGLKNKMLDNKMLYKRREILRYEIVIIKIIGEASRAKSEQYFLCVGIEDLNVRLARELHLEFKMMVSGYPSSSSTFIVYHSKNIMVFSANSNDPRFSGFSSSIIPAIKDTTLKLSNIDRRAPGSRANCSSSLHP